MNLLKTRKEIVVCALAIVSAGATQGSVLVSNVGEARRDASVLNALDWAAQSFETDASAYTLTSIDVILGQQTGSLAAFGELRASVMSGEMDVSASGLLETFTLPSDLGATFSVQTLLSAGTALAPNTRYYLLLGALGGDAPGSFDWSYAEGDASTGPGVFGPYQYSFDGGASWSLFGTENPFHMQVNVIPAPGATALGVLGVTAMTWRRRR